MAKKSSIIKNLKRKNLAKKLNNKRIELKKIIKNCSADFEERLVAMFKLTKLPRDSSKIRYRNRCSLSGRPRGYHRKFSLSRIALRDLAAWGQIPGLTKSSW